MKQKLLSLFLAVCMVVSMVVPAVAEETQESSPEELTYTYTVDPENNYEKTKFKHTSNNGKEDEPFSNDKNCGITITIIEKKAAIIKFTDNYMPNKNNPYDTLAIDVANGHIEIVFNRPFQAGDVIDLPRTFFDMLVANEELHESAHFAAFYLGNTKGTPEDPKKIATLTVIKQLADENGDILTETELEKFLDNFTEENKPSFTFVLTYIGYSEEAGGYVDMEAGRYTCGAGDQVTFGGLNPDEVYTLYEEDVNGFTPIENYITIGGGQGENEFLHQGGTSYACEYTFVNKINAPEKGTVTVIKQVIDKDGVEVAVDSENSFEFKIFEADEDDNPVGEAIATAYATVDEPAVFEDLDINVKYVIIESEIPGFTSISDNIVFTLDNDEETGYHRQFTYNNAEVGSITVTKVLVEEGDDGEFVEKTELTEEEEELVFTFELTSDMEGFIPKRLSCGINESVEFNGLLLGYNYTITELHDDSNKYYLPADGLDSKTVLLEKDEAGSADIAFNFENIYSEEPGEVATGSIALTKVLVDENDEVVTPEALAEYITGLGYTAEEMDSWKFGFTLNYDGLEAPIRFEIGLNETETIDKLPLDKEITITEVSMPTGFEDAMEDKEFKVTLSLDEESPRDIEVSYKNILNEKTQEVLGEIVVRKLLADESGNAVEGEALQAYLDSLEVIPEFTFVLRVGASVQAQKTCKLGEEVTFDGLPFFTTYTVEELTTAGYRPIRNNLTANPTRDLTTITLSFLNQEVEEPGGPEDPDDPDDPDDDPIITTPGGPITTQTETAPAPDAPNITVDNNETPLSTLNLDDNETPQGVPELNPTVTIDEETPLGVKLNPKTGEALFQVNPVTMMLALALVASIVLPLRKKQTAR